MHVLKNMAQAALALGFAGIADAFEVPREFGAYKTWLENAPIEEKREHFHDMSESYIEKHGENANKMRLCINLD